jgi:hypothetical protein
LLVLSDYFLKLDKHTDMCICSGKLIPNQKFTNSFLYNIKLLDVSFRYDAFKTGNCLSALESVKKEPCGIFCSLFINVLLNS